MWNSDREPALVTEARVEHIKEKAATVKAQMRQLQQIGKQMAQAPDGQISLTDPDARSMATSGRGTGMVGYNVQTAVDAEHHMIVAHEVTNVGHDREQLSPMTHQTRDAIGEDELTVLADAVTSKVSRSMIASKWVSRRWSPSQRPPATRRRGCSTKPIFATSRPKMSTDARPATRNLALHPR